MRRSGARGSRRDLGKSAWRRCRSSHELSAGGCGARLLVLVFDCLVPVKMPVGLQLRTVVDVPVVIPAAVP